MRERESFSRERARARERPPEPVREREWRVDARGHAREGIRRGAVREGGEGGGERKGGEKVGRKYCKDRLVGSWAGSIDGEVVSHGEGEGQNTCKHCLLVCATAIVLSLISCIWLSLFSSVSVSMWQTVMLFMKGDPQEAKCGFSRTIVSLLQEHDITFGYVGICAYLRVWFCVKRCVYAEFVRPFLSE